MKNAQKVDPVSDACHTSMLLDNQNVEQVICMQKLWDTQMYLVVTPRNPIGGPENATKEVTSGFLLFLNN